MKPRSHILGIDDAPFDKFQDDVTTLVAVMMEGADLVENVAMTEFSIDGEDATAFVVNWIKRLRCYPSVQAVILGGITIAGLSVIDIQVLSDELKVPVLVFNRKEPTTSELRNALISAKLISRIPIVEKTPKAVAVGEGQFLTSTGIEQDEAIQLFKTTLNKSSSPEPIRIAHLIGKAVVSGESRGRV